MTDKQFERAKQIQTDLTNLEQLKRELEKRIRVSFCFNDFKDLREPFIDVVEGKIAALKAEYERL